MNAKGSASSGKGFGQFMVNQTPRFDKKTVYSRKAGIYRPTKRRKKTRWI